MEPNLPPQQPIQQIPHEPEKKSKKKLLIFVVIAGVLVFLAAGVFFTRNNSTNNGSAVKETAAKILEQATPTPMPFRELTIPYLRERSYESKLSELELLANNGTYNSYVTSYESDGFRVNGLLTRPTGEEPEGGWPAIVFVHGYIPPAQYRTTGQYADYVDYLARSGFVVFKIDLRGHADSEGEPGGGYFGSDYIVDTLSARATLAASGFVDPDKIGLWGHSMAGNVLMRSWAAQPDIPAVVIWAGAVYTYTDREKYGINDNSFSPNQFSPTRASKRRELFEKYGSPSATSVFWRQVIPTNYAKDLKGALQIHHAANDDVVDIGYSRDLMKLLDKTSVPHELHEYPSGGHNIQGSSFNSAMERTVDFFTEQLSN